MIVSSCFVRNVSVSLYQNGTAQLTLIFYSVYLTRLYNLRNCVRHLPFNPVDENSILLAFCHLLIFLKKSIFLKMLLRNTIRVSNSLDPDQARRFVEPDLGLNLSADDTRR